jgi:hypothetical protein
MTDINLKTLTPDTSLPTTGFLFGADSQATANPSVYGVTTAITTILGNAASSDALVFNSDTTFSRGAIRNFRFGAADAATALAQTLSVQSVVAGTSNTAGAAFTINGSQGTGTGAGGSIIFRTAPAGGSGTAQNALVDALTIASDLSTRLEGNLNFSGTGTVNIESNTDLMFVRSAAYRWGIGQNFIATSSTAFIGWSSSGTNIGGTSATNVDTKLFRDAANTLAQRNGVNAQALNIYNTYTSSTSFERYSIDWITTANLAIVGPNKGSGGGTQRVQRLSYLEDGGAGSTVPLLGSTCPAASGTVKSWIKIITSDGTTAYIPCWA